MQIQSGNSLVSIVMPTFNSSEYLAQTIDSVLSQSFKNWELLITDDCSTDLTPQIIAKYKVLDSRIDAAFLSNNSGAAVCRNASINRAKGQYIAFLDSDDCWRENKLEVQHRFMEQHQYDLTFSAYQVMNDKGDSIDTTVDSKTPDQINYRQLLHKKATFGCLTVMFRPSAFSDFTMPNIRTGQDYALWLKLLRQTDYAFKAPGILADYRIVPGSISRNKIKKARRQWQIYRDLEKLSFIESAVAFRSYAWRAVFRR